jgi:hypothetical protein
VSYQKSLTIRQSQRREGGTENGTLPIYGDVVDDAGLRNITDNLLSHTIPNIGIQVGGVTSTSYLVARAALRMCNVERRFKATCKLSIYIHVSPFAGKDALFPLSGKKRRIRVTACNAIRIASDIHAAIPRTVAETG